MSTQKNMTLNLKIWRQKSSQTPGQYVNYSMNTVSPDMSFLEMLDVLNEELIAKGEEPIAFEHDCREGICGTCGVVIDGVPHGPQSATTTCQLHMRHYQSGATLTIEPWRAKAFPVIKDLVVDRSPFDQIIQAGGYISVSTGNAPDANALPISKASADLAMDAASCIGCGACVASCKNSSAMLFVGAKVSHLALLPQGAPERNKRVLAMVKTMDEAGFGNCTNERECEAACPKEISVENIRRLNKEYLHAALCARPDEG